MARRGITVFEITALQLLVGFLLRFLVYGAAVATAAPTTALQPGDIHLVAYASDNPDAFAVVSWVEMLQGTEIKFTDKGWDCNGFVSGESVIRYTAPHNLPAGTVISFENGISTLPGTDWEVESGNVIFSIYGDQLIVFQGTSQDPTPIFAFDDTGGWESCEDVASHKSRKSAIPTGLIDGETAVSFAHSDNFWYRPWYSTSATLSTLRQWMMDRDRFIASSSKRTDYQVPTSFTILTGQIGESTYTEYIPGTAPCILLAGHDGDLFPDSIADRNHGCYDAATSSCVWDKDCETPSESECRATTLNDENTQDMARRAADIFASCHGGSRCHLVVNRLGRIKLDPNRNEEEGAQFDATAIQAYQEFHQFAEDARNSVESSYGRGVLVDFHGHVHPEARIELGYKIMAYQLRKTDAEIDALVDKTSTKSLVENSPIGLSDVLRGPYSMGALFELETNSNSTGYTSVPSPRVPFPESGEKYFSGGYNIEVHGSKHGGTVDAIQIEFPRYLRDDYWEMQTDMLTAFGEVVLPQYLEHHYGFNPPGSCN